MVTKAIDLEYILSQMSLEDKIQLLSGSGFWHMHGFDRYGIPQISLNDGPHGIRKQTEKGDHLGLNESTQATCFPAESTLANSWDRNLLRCLGEALAQEADIQGVNILLGPGINIKRNPLCGRNFEYYSEDPYLAGELGAAFVRALQSQGVGASLKHFAANNQENGRMAADSLVDERALREIYLVPFEKVVKQARPATVMSAYNKLNGIFCSENSTLLSTILRKEWGFEGVVVSDWGGTHDRVMGVKAGLDLDMPGNGFYQTILEDAVREGSLSAAEIDRCVERLLRLIFSVNRDQTAIAVFDPDQHNELARKMAASSAVLLKNDGVLPVERGKKIAVVGQMAKSPRYQGTGSSQINPTRLYSALDGLEQFQIEYIYFDGYDDSTSSTELMDAAVAGVNDCDVILVFAGLPETAEMEGFDRENMKMPPSHNNLIEALCRVHSKVVVVLAGGSPVEMPWIDRVAGVLHMYLPGQAGGLAAVDVLFGVANPSGKLAESYPKCYEDVISAGFYGKDGKINCYRESIYVGYRYYDAADKDVLFPYGYGLSYTRFEYSDLQVLQNGIDDFTITAAIKNTGDRTGAEVVQLYVGSQSGVVNRPPKELKGFEKIVLEPGEQKQVSFHLDKRSFAYYDTRISDWTVAGGEYSILVGASSRDIRLQTRVHLPGDTGGRETSQEIPAWYWNPTGPVSEEDFRQLYGKPLPAETVYHKGSYTVECNLHDIQNTLVGKAFIRYVERLHAKTFGSVDYSNPKFKMVMAATLSMPLMKLALMSGGQLTPRVVHALVNLANGRFLRGVLKLSGVGDWGKKKKGGKGGEGGIRTRGGV